MADLPARRVIRALERAGFVLVRPRDSHGPTRHTALRRVAKDAGLDLDQLLALA